MDAAQLRVLITVNTAQAVAAIAETAGKLSSDAEQVEAQQTEDNTPSPTSD